MDYLSASNARANLYRLIDQVAEDHHPVLIKGKRAEAILVSKEDWEAIQETLYLSSIPGYVESIQEAIESPREEWKEAKDLGLL
jgi:prevent-host-death family protein